MIPIKSYLVRTTATFLRKDFLISDVVLEKGITNVFNLRNIYCMQKRPQIMLSNYGLFFLRGHNRPRFQRYVKNVTTFVK